MDIICLVRESLARQPHGAFAIWIAIAIRSPKCSMSIQGRLRLQALTDRRLGVYYHPNTCEKRLSMRRSSVENSAVMLFILVYQKTHPLQTVHGLHFGLSQPQAHYWYWVHHLLPILQRALADLGLALEVG
jgi:Helix-turn-helix of DDE superfamily endonuclease